MNESETIDERLVTLLRVATFEKKKPITFGDPSTNHRSHTTVNYRHVIFMRKEKKTWPSVWNERCSRNRVNETSFMFLFCMF